MKSAVLFIIFKKVDTTLKVFEKIREVRPPRLYIAADGPRLDKSGEVEQCMATRKIVENIDWPCEVHRLYREENLGCGKGVSSAISWFFEYEEEGIIIEDDILPHIDFFRYCDEMLEKYRHTTRVKCVCGNNKFYEKVSYPYSFFFSHYVTIWGWATWRRTWKEYDYSLKSISKTSFLRSIELLPVKKECKVGAINIFNIMVSDNPIDTWDYQLLFSIWYNDGLNIIPINNLCKNIGIGHVDAIHTTIHDDKIEAQVMDSIFPMKYPPKIKDSRKLDKITFMELYTPTQGNLSKMKQMYYSLRAKIGFRTKLGLIIKRIKSCC